MSRVALEMFVPGIPAPQGSKRFVGRTGAGRGLLIESSKRVGPWRSDVRAMAVAAMAGEPPVDGPLGVRWEFTFPRPKSHHRANGQLRPDAPVHHVGPPDLSKLIRALEDALEGVVWSNDSRLAAIGAVKLYGDRPGVVIAVRTLAVTP